MECLNPHFVFVRYFTHDQIYNPNRNYDLKCSKNFFSQIKSNSDTYATLTSQQSCYWALDYFNNIISVL